MAMIPPPSPLNGRMVFQLYRPSAPPVSVAGHQIPPFSMSSVQTPIQTSAPVQTSAPAQTSTATVAQTPDLRQNPPIVRVHGSHVPPSVVLRVPDNWKVFYCLISQHDLILFFL